jgi:hypothetical protein
VTKDGRRALAGSSVLKLRGCIAFAESDCRSQWLQPWENENFYHMLRAHD